MVGRVSFAIGLVLAHGMAGAILLSLVLLVIAWLAGVIFQARFVGLPTIALSVSIGSVTGGVIGLLRTWPMIRSG